MTTNMVDSILSFSKWIILSALFHNIRMDGGVPVHLLCHADFHDYFNLTALPWYFNIEQPNCLALYNGNRSTHISQCQVVIGFCQPLTVFGGQCQNSSVCQRSVQGSLNLGGYSEQPFLGKEGSKSGFEAIFPPGSSYYTAKKASCALKTSVSFHCNESAKWYVPEGARGMLEGPTPVSMDYDADKCEVKLSFDYAGACPWQGTNHDKKTLSIGFFILIEFVAMISLYFIIGSFYNLLRGKSGWKIIPNSSFWCMLPAYIKDGWKFICCNGGKSAAGYEQVKHSDTI